MTPEKLREKSARPLLRATLTADIYEAIEDKLPIHNIICQALRDAHDEALEGAAKKIEGGPIANNKHVIAKQIRSLKLKEGET